MFRHGQQNSVAGIDSSVFWRVNFSRIKFYKTGIFLILSMFASLTYCKDLKVLTVGNSFSSSVFRFLPAMVKSIPDCGLEIMSANLPGCSFEGHLREFEKSEKNPEHKPYGRSFSHKEWNLRQLLTMKKWDVIVIQQASQDSWNWESYQPHADQLIRLIRKYVQEAEIIIQQTWAYRSDDPRISGLQGKWGFDQSGMYERLTDNYLRLAKEYRLRIIPVGYAVQISRERSPVKYVKPDPGFIRNLRNPDLPSVAGDVIGNPMWQKNSKGEMWLSNDMIHPNIRGWYLQACVWFAILYDKKASEISYVPNTIGDDDARFLRDCAQEAIDGFPQVKR